jgi:hypothetical protein
MRTVAEDEHATCSAHGGDLGQRQQKGGARRQVIDDQHARAR